LTQTTESEKLSEVVGSKTGVSQSDFVPKTINKDGDRDNVGGKSRMHKIDFVPERVLKGMVVTLLNLKGYRVVEEKPFTLQHIDIYAEKDGEKLVIEVESSKDTYREGLKQLSHVYVELKDNARYILVLPNADEDIVERAKTLGFEVWTLKHIEEELKRHGFDGQNYIIQAIRLGKFTIKNLILDSLDPNSISDNRDEILKILMKLDRNAWIRKVECAKNTVRKGNKKYVYMRKRVDLPNNIKDKYVVIMPLSEFRELIMTIAEILGVGVDKEMSKLLYEDVDK